MTSLVPNSSRFHSLWSWGCRAVLLAALALAVLLDSVELHGHHPLLERSSLEVVGGGCHPELATHLEPTPADQHLDCPGCLSRLRLQGSHLVPVVCAVVAPLPLYALDELRAAAFATPRQSPSSRGPPPPFA